jgi:tight adherence protein B
VSAGQVLAAAAVVLTVLVLALWNFITVHLERAELARRSELARVEYEASRVTSRLDVALRRTSLGASLELQVSRAGVVMSALDLLAIYLGAALAGFVLIVALAPTPAGLGGAALGLWAVRRWLEARRAARAEEFVAQLPELTRTLSNATAAGRSLRSAIDLAADIDEPARSELRLVSERLRLGQSIDDALEELKQRLPSRELGVLVSTLVIQQRSGGDVVTALREMANTLEARKELRREIKTVLASAVQTGYVTGGLGIVLILAANVAQPGMIDLMARRPAGQIALTLSAGLYATGWFLTRRLTAIDV